VVTTVAEEQIS